MDVLQDVADDEIKEKIAFMTKDIAHFITHPAVVVGAFPWLYNRFSCRGNALFIHLGKPFGAGPLIHVTKDIAQNVFRLAYDGSSLVCENEDGTITMVKGFLS